MVIEMIKSMHRINMINSNDHSLGRFIAVETTFNRVEIIINYYSLV